MIRLSYYTPSVMLTNELTDVTIFTDHNYVDFRMTVNGSEVLCERYYALNGRIVVADIASLVEQATVGNTEGEPAEVQLEAYVGEDEENYTGLTFSAIYCDKSLDLFDPSTFLLQNFLTLSAYRRLPPESYFELAWYSKEREGIMFRVYATYVNNATGVRGTYWYAHSGNGMVSHMDCIQREKIFLPQVVEKIKSVQHIESVTLLSVTARCGERSLTVIVDPALSDVVPFYYTNCFNVIESLYLPRVTTEKIKSDRSIASLGKSSCFYDITHSKEYDVQSGPLTADECVQVEQMLTSPAVHIPYGYGTDNRETDFYAMQQILITDYTSEISDSDEKPNTVKFTWRFIENRPQMSVKYSPEIFDSHFNPTFN